MTVTITRTPSSFAGTTINPFMITEARFSRPSKNILHDVIGSTVPDVTSNNVGTREGSFTFLCLDRTAAFNLEMFHYTAGSFELTDTDNPAFNMSYVLAEGGAITITLDPDTRKRYTVTVDVKGIA